MTQHSKIGLIAGGGHLPPAIAKAMAEANRRPFVIGLAGQWDSEWAQTFHYNECPMEKVGAIINNLKAQGCDRLVFVGKVHRPDFKKLRPDFVGWLVFWRIWRAAQIGDDSLLRAVMDVFETRGIRVLSQREVAGKLILPQGDYAARLATQDERRAIERAMSIIRGLAANHPAQALIVKGATIVGVEDKRGTDALLEDAAANPSARGGVLVKALRHAQDIRVDLPTLGLQTIKGARRAGLAGVAWAADECLILDQAAMVQEANAAQMFLRAETPP